MMITQDRPAFVERAYQWWKAQTWLNKELIVVDDSVPSKRFDFGAGFNGKHVKHIKLNDLVEMGAKHDLALKHAQGSILTYWDDDDLFMPTRLVRQLEPIVLEQVQITGIPRAYIVQTPGAVFYKFRPNDQLGSLESWIGNGVDRWAGNGGAPIKMLATFHDGTAMFKRDIIGDFKHPPVRVGQKVDFINQLIRAGNRWLSVVNNRLFVYVRHGKNTWNYNERKVHLHVSAPAWVPNDTLEFWRKGALL